MDIEEIKNRNWHLDTIEERMEAYGEFLEPGEFETWQPYCYEKDGTDFKKIGLCLAWKQKAKTAWIMSRFVEYYGAEWRNLNAEFSHAMSMFHWYQADLKKKKITVN